MMGQGPTQGTGPGAAGAISTRKCNFKALRLKVDEKNEREERTKAEARKN